METIIRRFLVTNWRREMVVGKRVLACIFGANPARNYCLVESRTRQRNLQAIGLYQFLQPLEGLALFESNLGPKETVHRPKGVIAWVEVTDLLTDKRLRKIAATLPIPSPKPLHKYVLEQLSITAPPS